MKTRVFWAVTTAVLVFGLILVIFGTMLGAKKSMGFGTNGLVLLGNDDLTTISEKNLSPFSSISVDSVSLKTEIVYGDSYGFSAAYRNRELNWDNVDGRLIITEKVFRGGFWFFNMDFSFLSRGKDSYIKIYVPYGTQLDTLRVNSTSGGVLVGDLQCNDATIDVISGGTDILGLKAKNLSVNLTSGGMHLDRCEADIGRFSTISGKTEVLNSKIGQLTMDSMSGSTSFSGEILQSGDIQSTSGRINLDITGKSEDFYKEISKVSGSLYINGTKVKGYSDFNTSSQGGKPLRINAMSGSVRVNFR